MNQPQQIIAGRYHLGEVIGQGGMGTVYRGHDRLTDTPVAIKVLRPEVISSSPAILERFVREGEVLRQLNHPNIVKLLDALEDDRQHYLVMDYVAGGSLHGLLRETPQLPVARVLAIGLGLADALTRAHQLHIIHRDLKPANVLLDETGVACLTDFGVARIGESHLTETGALLGTLSYLSPEACRSEELDARSDIWSFGIMLFEMLAGRLPFGGDNPAATLTAILMDSVPDLEALRPDAPVALVDLVYRMLEKDRRVRIASVRQVGAALEAVQLPPHAQTLPLARPREDAAPRFATPTPSSASLRHNLPVQPTPFVGRSQELLEVRDQLADPGVRLLTILGPGGMGKTRLALEAAGAQLDRFSGGVYFVPLAPISGPEFIASTIAESLRFTFIGQEDPQAELVNFLREKQVLLVLDNCEHVIDGAGLVGDILAAAPAVKVLATSRERLRLSGEALFYIAGMGVPEDDSPETLADSSAAALFVQSARRVRPDFAIDATTAPHIARILRQVEGMPLGIELAAGWLGMLPLDEIGDEIARSIDFLETDLRDVPARQRSIRAVFDYSWQLLPEAERDALMKLASFRGGFEREAAQAITEASLRTLTGLITRSLLRRDPGGRYSLHVLLRQYAEDQFARQPEQEAVRRAHAAYYFAFLASQQAVFASAQEKSAVERVEAEFENIRLAWRTALALGCWDDLSPALYALALFYQARSMLREGV
ncbi:MAG: protein kinase, partial [Anaerolineae bacterium]|nr:protein kinase [Anaerolineae bacterium]